MFRKINAIRERHGKHVIAAIGIELFIRSYRLSPIRRLLKLCFRQSRPKGAIFVVGVYNSGTTMIKDILGLHPEISTLPIEGDKLTNLLPNHEGRAWPRGVYGELFKVSRERREFPALDVESLLSDWRPWVRNGAWLVEKSVLNSFRIKRLQDCFPNVRFLCIFRDPSEVVSGIARRSKPRGVAKQLLRAGNYPDQFLLRQWLTFYKTIWQDCQKYNCRVYFVNYQSVLSTPKETIENVFKFLDVDVPSITETSRGIAVGEKEFLLNRLPKSVVLPACHEGDERLALVQLINEIERRLEK